jgi:hypothetical protein
MKYTFCFMLLLSFSRVTPAQEISPHNAPPILTFQIAPVKHTFSRHEEIVVRFTLQNNSPYPVFVSRKMYSEFVDLTVFAPNGKEVEWRGTGRIDSKAYSLEDFAVLKTGESVSQKTAVSLKQGVGFVIDKPGRYRMKAEYSLGPPAYFAPFARDATVPEGPFRAQVVTLCVETCGPSPQAS